MKRFFSLALGLTLAVTVPAQVLINAGDSFTYEFSTLLGPLYPQSVGGISGFALFTFDAPSLQAGDMLRVDQFENSVLDAPIETVFYNGNTFPIAISHNGAWLDHQGAVRLSVLAGSVALNQVNVTVSDFNGPLGRGQVFYDSLVVPEPGAPLLILSSAAVFGIWRLRPKKAVVAP